MLGIRGREGWTAFLMSTQSIAYIKDLQALIDSGVTDKETLYTKHTEAYGGRINPHALQGGFLFAVGNLE